MQNERVSVFFPHCRPARKDILALRRFSPGAGTSLHITQTKDYPQSTTGTWYRSHPRIPLKSICSCDLLYMYRLELVTRALVAFNKSLEADIAVGCWRIRRIAPGTYSFPSQDEVYESDITQGVKNCVHMILAYNRWRDKCLPSPAYDNLIHQVGTIGCAYDQLTWRYTAVGCMP